VRQKASYTIFKWICLLIFAALGNVSFAQSVSAPSAKSISNLKLSLNSAGSFIENIGQYGPTMKGYEAMGKLVYGYEGLGVPVLFTPKGLIHLQRKVEKLSHEEEEKLERAGAKEAEIEYQKNITDRTITMEWLGANPDVKIIAEEKEAAYHTYGMLPDKAYGYKKITYKNLYPGIDVVYNFTNNTKPGFEYNLIVHPGADLSVVKMKYGGDVKKIKTDNKGNLVISSDIDGISITIPVSYYGERLLNKNNGEVKTGYKIENNEISFSFPQGYDNTKPIILDPFVSSTANLTGVFAGKAIDVDYDYEGNVYVAGGGSTNQSGTASHSHAKYNSAGVLQWTFNGILTIPTWRALYYYGGWVVDKASGALYMGQGFSFPGFQVIRVNTQGLYDNYISTANASFQEDWKMYWYCNNGNPQIICAGGGTTANNNFAVCAPPATNLVSSANLTGAAAAYQDMSDLVIDPVTNSMYSIYASGLDKTVENKIFKNNQPYSAATIAWSTPSGYTVLGEILNRPYLGGSYAENSTNSLAINANYLFYWDGRNLKAFDKATGAAVGTPLTAAANLALYQGGIVADACNNVFIGSTGGIIKVYNFNGTAFDDAPVDISIPGFGTKSVYDLALDESKKLLYASGDGFVGSFDVTAYCPTTLYTVNVVPNCVTASATATVTPTPPAGSTVTYALYIGTTLIATNTTGVFTGLNPNITYTIVATINFACSGIQATATFILPGPTITFTQTNTTCGASIGAINATGTPGPCTYSLNGGPFQPTGNFTGLPAGLYTLVVQGAGGCLNDTTIIILNSNGPALTYTQTNATCGSNTGTVTANATGGTAPYQYSINGGTTYQTGNFFTGLVAGQYTLVVKDAAGCTNRTIITITTSPVVALTATPASATCGQNNGTITAFGSGGTAPLQYSINGNIFQVSTFFTGLTPGVYTVTVKDAIGCTKTATVTVNNFPAPTVTATSNGATCNNINGSIIATGSSGLTPYQYSINGGTTYQSGNIFAGLAPGVYTITIKDASGCTSTVTVTVGSTNAPSVTAVATISSCAANTGSITATGSGGTGPYLYSINGTFFQVSGFFPNLAPGNYAVFVKDNAGCIAAIRIVVGAVSGPSIAATATPSSCIANDGTITATGTGGTAPLLYCLDGVSYAAPSLFTGLASGLYTVYVKDANGCIKTTTVSVASFSGLTLAVSAISSSCSINNGTITATATGGVAPLQYNINGGAYQLSNIFNGLGAGTYIINVKDANNCIVTKQAIVTAVTGPSFTLAVEQNATCGTASGVIRVTAVGGVAPLSYNIDGGAFQLVPIFPAVAPGLHTIIVKDATGCTAAAQTITITNSGTGTAITDVTFTVNGVLACTGEGRIKNLKGVPSGGGRIYEFSLDGGPFTTANQFRPVSIGYHTITARLVGSVCTVTRIAQIGVGTPATATATSTASACGQSTGTITLTGVGVNVPFHASIDNGVTWITFDPTTTFTGLAPATYPIIIADDADFKAGPPDIPGACLTTIYVTVPSTGGPTISTTQVNPTCTVNTGSITATGSGGTAPYTYSVDGGPYINPPAVFNNLAPGLHVISVKDATGCINGVNVTIANASVPTVSANVLSTSCGLSNGSVTATGTGGVAPLEYSINGTVFVSTNIFTGLTPGNYTLYVRDANRCFSSIPVTIANTPLPKVNAFTIAATCNNNDGSIIAEGSFGETPYTFSINGTAYQSSNTFDNLAAGFYTVYIKDARGCITTTGVTVTNIGAPVFTTTTVAAKCGIANGSITVTVTGGSGNYQYSSDGGVTFQVSNILTPLAPGTYAVAVKDINNGCIVSQAILVPNLNGPQTLTAVIVDAACGNANGSITAAATGGAAPLQYSIDGTNYFPTNVFNTVGAGGYTLYVRDANLCVKTLPVTILNLPAPLLTATTSPSSCGLSDGTITAIANGGTLPLTYSRDGITFQTSNIFLNLAAGPYTITVKDARGCTTAFIITVATAGTTTTPTFNPVAPICSGATLAPLPTTSLNGITGTWAPALNNTATITYTFTPNAGQCATTATLTITVNPNVIPTFTPVAPICSGDVLNPLPTTSLNGITGTWAPVLNNSATITYTFTPTAGLCATTTTLTITVNATVTPTFTAVAPVCSGATLAALPSISLNGITGTWAPALNNTTTTIYTFTPTAGQCATITTLTITVNPNITPTFTPVAAICSGTVLNPLPTTSLNGITGTWTPALNNTGTTVYTFTPTAGLCATTTTLTITVNANITPTFTPVAAICSGAVLSALPTTSNNGITGAWSPALNNTGTTIYTFTPTAGQCATTATLTITVNADVTPTFTPVAAICSGTVLNPLPTTSLNGITGTWAPALNNTGTTVYTFTPTAGQCATTATLTITVNANVTPTFNAVAPICSGAILNALPTTSLNGITGTWAPALNNTGTTVYTFTPTAGQCAAATTLTITVNPILSATINCGVSTTSSVIFNWAAVAGATGYNVSYQINANPVVTIGSIGNVLTYPVTALAGGDNVTITVTPTGGAGTCFIAATKVCTATACTPPTASISYAGQFCVNITAAQAVTLTGTGVFTGGTYSSTAGLTINAASGAITPSTSTPATYIVTYTVAASGGCAGVTATASVTINPKPAPIIYHN
jgi:hypothetical protein